MGYKYIKFTSVGFEKKINEDALEVIETGDGLLAILCDGVGGDYGGDLAARIAIKSATYFYTSSDLLDHLERIKYTIEEANSFVLNHSANSTSVKNMATTFEILFMKDNIIYWGHIGDSRIYHLKSKRLTQITKDHSLVQKLLDEGYISHRQAEIHPQKNVIIKALGDGLLVQPDISKIKINENEINKFFLCSDGVSNLLGIKELEEILVLTDYEEIKSRLITTIKSRGAYDDYSFILLENVK
ncbi:MAG: protein phosphatase 2C domain-containing protein [Ignavibacteriaceae bacterium]